MESFWEFDRRVFGILMEGFLNRVFERKCLIGDYFFGMDLNGEFLEF